VQLLRLTLAALLIIPAAQPQFRSEAHVIQVPVSVLDKKGHEIEGLTAADFQLLDDGLPQSAVLDTFGTGVAPISLVIAIQTSGISTPALAKIRRVGGMFGPLVVGGKGEAAIITFSAEVKLTCDFTSDSARLQNTFSTLNATGYKQARMLDAVGQAVLLMQKREGRKVIFLISETRDRGSDKKYPDTVAAIQRDGIEIFAAHYSAYATTWTAKPSDLPESTGQDLGAIFTEIGRMAVTNDIQALTDATGGSDYPFLKGRGLENSIEKLGVELHAQYILSFPRPEDSTQGLHKIEVLVPSHPEARIKARKAWSY
jgi:VWFA-related protein